MGPRCCCEDSVEEEEEEEEDVLLPRVMRSRCTKSESRGGRFFRLDVWDENGEFSFSTVSF